MRTKRKLIYDPDAMPPVTLEQAKGLKVGDRLFTRFSRDSQGMPRVVRVSGRPQIWKRSPERVSVPVKFGMYDSFRLSEFDIQTYSTILPDPVVVTSGTAADRAETSEP